MTVATPPRPRSRLGSRRRLTIAVIVLLGAIGALLYQGLSNAATYFYTADQAVARRDQLGARRFRIEGTVVPGTVHTDGDAVDFQIANNGTTVDVRHTGGQPELFKPNVPVVLEGRWDGARFASDLIMIRHSASYTQQHPDRVQDYKP